MVRPSGGGNEALEFLAHLRSVHRMVGESERRIVTPACSAPLIRPRRISRRSRSWHERVALTRPFVTVSKYYSRLPRRGDVVVRNLLADKGHTVCSHFSCGNNFEQQESQHVGPPPLFSTTHP